MNWRFPFRSRKSETISMLLEQLEDTRQELSLESVRRVGQDELIKNLKTRAERAEELAERSNVEREELTKTLATLNAKLIERMSQPESKNVPMNEFMKDRKPSELTRRVSPTRKMWKDAFSGTIAAQSKPKTEEKPGTTLEASMEALMPENLVQ